MKTSRPIKATIHPDAVLANYQLAKSLAPRAKAWAVVKANAYGHGQWRVVNALQSVADGFALLEVENAIALREAGIRQPILLLEGFFAERDVRAIAQYELTTVIHCTEQLDMLLAASSPETPLSLYLKINSGMNRLGIRPAALPDVLEKLSGRAVDLTLMSHFASADVTGGIAAQMACLKPLTANWSGRLSLANSAAILDYPETHADWVRPGIMLYGASPFAERRAEALGLQTTMTLESRIISVQQLQAGDSVGYGAGFTAERPMRVGIVACGYADGYPRHAPTGTPLSVHGSPTRTLGRVSMDMLACDLTEIPQAGLGSPVTLWGGLWVERCRSMPSRLLLARLPTNCFVRWRPESGLRSENSHAA